MTDKKLFIIAFGTPILRDVVLRLQDAGARIVYWEGYRDYFKTIARDKEHFPNTIFHYANDVIRNIPPRKVDAGRFKPPSRELIEKLAPYQSTAMFLISRIDYTNWPLSQKRNLYYQYIRFWNGMLDAFAPDAILFPDVPHGANHYVLYTLARVRNTKVIIAEQIAVESRTVLINDYELSAISVRDYYESHKDYEYRVKDLSPDLHAYYEKHTQPHRDATPEYQKRALRSRIPFRTPTVRTIFHHIIRLSFFGVAFSYLRMLWMKNEEQTLGPPMRGITYARLAKHRARFNDSLKKTYERLQRPVDAREPYVYMPLNVQPERTTCPQGGIYDDQLFMIETVSASLPKGWNIYVKENPNQLRPGSTFTCLYRYHEYYERIARLPNVRLVPIETSTYKLILGAGAVATATGTAGWEGLLRGKPALVFGSVWYMYCDGVFRVSDVASCRAALSMVAQGYVPDRQHVLNYLVALDRNSIRARHFRTLRYEKQNYTKEDYLSHEDNVKNLSHALYHAILH